MAKPTGPRQRRGRGEGSIFRYGLVYTDQVGRYVRPWAAHHALRRILAAAGLPPVSVHALRRSCAVAMLSGGASLFQVSRQLGHSGVAITEAHYAGLAAELRRETASALDRVLGGGG
jgi:integrase